MSHYIPLSLPRRLMRDLLHASRKIPIVPMERRMDISVLSAVISRLKYRPSLCSVFLKAFAAVCSREANLRRSFAGGRIFQHDRTIASVAIAREDETFFTQVRSPEEKSIARIDAHLRLCKTRPVDNFPLFRWALDFAALPRPLRRLMIWWALRSGSRRERYFGTFGISVTAGLGAAALHQWTPFGIALNYGVLEDGKLDVRLMYDHRIWDGAFIASMLVELEHELTHNILLELQEMGPRNDHIPTRGRRSNVSVLHRSQSHAGGELAERGRDAAKPLEGSSARPRTDETGP